MRQIKRGHYKEDEFQNTMEKAMKYIVRHRDKSIMIGIAVVAVAVLFIMFLGRGEQSNPQADLLHTQALGFMTTGRIQEAEGVLRELTERYQNTRAGKLGLYYMGILTYHTGRFNESLEFFNKFLSVEKNDYLLSPSAMMGAGSAAEGIGDYERALRYYEQMAQDEKSPLHDLGTLNYGRVLGVLGNTDRSRAVLEELIANDPPGDIAADANFYLGYFDR
jgi:tetratricopeptide (TPR) repeat protein